MLRRPPTTLHITPEDIAAYEDRRASETRAAEAEARAQQQQQQQQQEQQQPGAEERIMGRRRR
ncbi:hypothetical protein E4U30_000535 [Claviceps sp. LM220 group G6]|nr:hypothetical protein E4U15_006608 [Claviceps sp. LM218 group G6]KAG6097498.1 hypothetical protein E4U31_005095 [Claviceps sp. LM219 group G6]KAG6097553.1 hypothetical protein E4U30_000535 [Claviceps sp. LM220 group G6]